MTRVMSGRSGVRTIYHTTADGRSDSTSLTMAVLYIPLFPFVISPFLFPSASTSSASFPPLLHTTIHGSISHVLCFHPPPVSVLVVELVIPAHTVACLGWSLSIPIQAHRVQMTWDVCTHGFPDVQASARKNIQATNACRTQSAIKSRFTELFKLRTCFTSETKLPTWALIASRLPALHCTALHSTTQRGDS